MQIAALTVTAQTLSEGAGKLLVTRMAVFSIAFTHESAANLNVTEPSNIRLTGPTSMGAIKVLRPGQGQAANPCHLQ